METRLFEHSDPKEFLVSILKEKQSKNPRFSLRSWSKQLGFSSPNMLSMILRGERNLKPRLATKISESLNLPDNEQKYLEMLAVFSNAKSKIEKDIYANVLSNLRPDKKFSTIELDEFKLISDWYHLTIIEMLDLNDFKADPTWISKRLGNTVSPQIIESAINRLIRLKILKREKNGKLTKVGSFQTTYDISNEAIKKYHTQMINKALDALKNQAVEEREISSNTFTVDTKKLPDAKKVIRKFQDDLSKLVSKAGGDETYQLNIQFFKLTEGDKS